PAEAETVLYRLVQEALTNVIKHAAAEHVSIVLTRRDGGVSAVIEDDGRGFAEENVGEQSLGLVGMRERLALLGGTLGVESGRSRRWQGRRRRLTAGGFDPGARSGPRAGRGVPGRCLHWRSTGRRSCGSCLRT